MKYAIIAIVAIMIICFIIVYACIAAGSHADDQMKEYFDNHEPDNLTEISHIQLN